MLEALYTPILGVFWHFGVDFGPNMASTGYTDTSDMGLEGGETVGIDRNMAI